MKRLALFLALAFSIHAADAPPKWKKLNPQTPAGFTLKTIEVEKHPEHNVELYVYVPDAPGSYPCILDIHGGGWKARQVEADKPMMERLAQRGFVTALVSYRLSTEAKYPAAIHDCKAALRCLRAHAKELKLDPERIGLWGSSYGGGHVLAVAAIDRRVRAVVSQVPTISGHHQARRRNSADAMRAMRARFDADRLARMRGEPPATMPLVSNDPARPAYFNGQRPWDNYMIDGFVNEITLRSVERNWEYEPAADIDRISPTPLLMIVADADEATPSDLALQAYARALEPKRLLIVKGGHFTPYWEHFDRTSAAASDWLLEHLQG